MRRRREDGTRLLFSYGTLQDKQVQLSLFGRKLIGRRAYLLGYEQPTAPVEYLRVVAKLASGDQTWVYVDGRTVHEKRDQGDAREPSRRYDQSSIQSSQRPMRMRGRALQGHRSARAQCDVAEVSRG